MIPKQFKAKLLNRKVVKTNSRPRPSTRRQGGKSKSKSTASSEGDDGDGDGKLKLLITKNNFNPNHLANLLASSITRLISPVVERQINKQN